MTSVPPYDSAAFHAAALQLRSRRQEVLASNLANADTPGYLARDLDFSSALREKMQGLNASPQLPMTRTASGHLAGLEASSSPSLAYRTVLQPSADGNTVDPDVERAHFAENTTGFELATALLSSTMRGRQMAITGQP
jgi:flagellar basal-body rod protein FlgB